MNMTMKRSFLAVLFASLIVGRVFAADAPPGASPELSAQQAPAAAAMPATPAAPKANAPTVDEAAKAAKARADKEDKEVWSEAVSDLLPITPDEVKELKSRQRQVQEAAKPREAPARAISNAIPVSMQPGASSPRVQLMHGFVTAIEVLDETGKPWPIVSVRQGDPKAVSVEIEGAAQGAVAVASSAGPIAPGTKPISGVVVDSRQALPTANVVTVNPTSPFASTNLMLVLAGASRPISVVLISTESNAQAELSDRVTLLVAGAGPYAAPEVATNYDHLDAGEDLRNALVGRPPTKESAEILTDLPNGMRAWRADGILWVRTSERIISPAPQASVAMGELRAYRLPYLPVIVAARQGKMTEVSLTTPLTKPKAH